MKKIVSSIVFLLATSTMFASWIPSEKYAKWVSHFKVDKAWQFENGSHNEGAGGSTHSGTSLVDFPGTIAWSFMSWDERTSNSDDHNMDWFELYLRNGDNDNDMITITRIKISGGDNDYWPTGIENFGQNKTYYTQGRWYDHADGSWFCYMVTEYSEETRQFIERAGSNLQVKVRTRWDDNHWNTYTKASTVDYSDRQFLPLPNQPSVNNVEWTTHDNKTAVAYTRSIPNGCTFRLRSLYNGKEVFCATSSNTATSVTDYTYPLQQSNKPKASEMYATPLTYECYSDKTYKMPQTYYKNCPTSTRTISSEKVTFTAPPFAQVEHFDAKDNNDGTIAVSWKMTPCTGSTYDNSPIRVEYATDANFTQNLKKELVDYVATKSDPYKIYIPFDERDNDSITYHFRAYRDNASPNDAIFDAVRRATVNTNYVSLSTLDYSINDHYQPVLRWKFKSGVCTSKMQLQIHFASLTRTLEMADAIISDSLVIDDALATCEPITFTVKIVEGTKVLGEEKKVTLVIPNDMRGVIASHSVSKGFYNDRVQLRWKIDAEQYNFRYFQVSRKELNTNDEPVILGTIDFKNGVLDYAFEDVTCVPGAYYEYRIIGYSACEDQVKEAARTASIGFAQPYGVVSGQITYSGNQGVPNVAVSVVGEDVRRSRSLRFLAKNNATLSIPKALWEQMVGEEGTIEFYQSENGPFKHIAYTYNADSLFIYENGQQISKEFISARPFADGFTFGGASFDGFIDEIRVWKICRSQEEIQRTMNVYLSGSESGLTGYYRCDDEIEGELFDISRRGITFNEHHLTMHGIVPDQDHIPTPEQLALKAYTDKNGNYLINNVPYTVGGSLYNVIPILGVHEYSPSSRPLFFSRDAATHNSIDFTDKSSFEVSGKVTFENTDYPVKGCQFYVDGQICANEGSPIESDAEGNYTIQVPIGEHAITVKKDGHTFVNEGRYPADPSGTGVKAKFDAPRNNLSFYDNTTVLVVGRVAGGADEAAKAHGFELGKATIGQARIVLTPPEDTYNLNLSTTEGRTFACPDSIVCHSMATTGVAEGNKAHSVTITTDATTGEFAVALPPVDFEIKKVEIPSNPAILFDLGKFENLTLGSGNIRQTTTDTLYTDSVNYKTVTYLQKLDAIYYAQPELTITQWGNQDGALGEKTYFVGLPSGQVDTLPLYTVENDQPTYTLGTPAYLQGKTYSWDIHVFETYINNDAPKTPVTTLQPMRNAIVTIENELGEKEVAQEDGKYVGEKGDTMQVVAGQIISLEQNQVLLDSLGMANYLFTVGQPNIVEPYTYNTNITFEDAQHTRVYSWEENGKCKGLIFGARTTGTNFVTEGPDKLLFVLRDPPGGQSSATWKSGESVTTTEVTTNENNRGTDITSVHYFGASFEVVSGIGFATITETEGKNNITVGAKADGSTQWSHTNSYEVTSSQTISTQAGYPYVGTRGDVFVGASTNILFGNAREVDLERIQDNPRKYKVVVRDAISTGSAFKTTFAYTTMDIEDKVIPNYIKQRNALLRHVDEASYNEQYPNLTHEPIYITTLAESDPRYGSNNHDSTIWGDKATSMNALAGPSYIMIPPQTLADTSKGCIDQICHFNNQIRRWQNVLANNEENKVKVHHVSQKFDPDKWEDANEKVAAAIRWRNVLRDINAVACRGAGQSRICSREYLEEDYANSGIDTTHLDAQYYYTGGWLLDNISLGGGATVTSSKTTTTGDGTGKTELDGFKGLLKTETGLQVNKFGFNLKTDSYLGYNRIEDNQTMESETSTIEYTLNINDYEYMSVDVYAAPDGYGPIFSTRGGQTYCPYEGEERTKYFEPGEHELHTATVSMEEPQIRAEVTTVTDVPIGGKAIYTLNLANTADVDKNYFTWLKLYAASDYNPLGAQLSVDGSVLTDAGRLIKFYPSQPIVKTLVVTQTDLGVLDYDSLAVILSSDCSSFQNADTVWLAAHFVPTCSDVHIRIDNTTINTTTGNKLAVTIDGYDRNFRNFKSIRLQYRQTSENDWHLIREFCTNPADTVGGQKTLIDGAAIYYTLEMTDTQFPDGEYEFRAVTACTFGNDEIPNESDIVSVVKDMLRPVALGLPSPINGIYTSDNQIYVDFNKPIQMGRIRDKNISVQGVLNAHNVGDHAVALQIGEEALMSEAEYNFNNINLTFEFWYNYQRDGLILTHAGGTDIGLFLLVTGGRLAVEVGNYLQRSQDTIPQNTWCFISIQYEADLDNDGWSTLTAHCAYDNYNICLFDHIRAPKYDKRSNLLVGGLNQCKMHDLAIWTIDRDWSTSLSERNKHKDSYTDGLLSYWPMNEGEGFEARDIVRGRNLKLPTDSWYYNNNNIALAIPASQTVKMDLSECPIPAKEDFVFECWFRMTQDGTLMTLSDSSLSIGFSVNCMLLTIGNETKVVTAPGRIVNGAWHHLAINYRHNTPPIFMVDGQILDVNGIEEMPAFASSSIIFSSEKSETEVGLDEVRLWNAYLTPQNIALNRRNELKGDEAGLVAYYPMEKDTVDEAMQPIKVLSLEDRVSKHTLRPYASTPQFPSTTSPALTKQRPIEQVKHTYTPSAQRLVINITEPVARIEGCTLEFEVTDLVDEHGNYSTPIHWTTYVNRNQLLWGEEMMKVTKTALKDTTFTITIANNSGKVENWYIANAPIWLVFSETSGILQPLQKKELTATIQASLAIGNYDQTIYLVGNETVKDPLRLTVRVNGEKPNWTINPADYEYSMNIIATATIDNAPADDSEDLVAAFIGNELVGLGSPRLYSSYGRHYIMMNIYANLTQAEKDSINYGLSLSKPVTFKYWDASTGLIYSHINITLPSTESQPWDVLNFTGGKLVGSMTNPITLQAGRVSEQTLQLKKGWNWISFNVLPDDTNINSVLKGVIDDISIIKSFTEYAQLSAIRDSLRGSLKVIDCLKGYKLNINKPYSKTVTGSIINPVYFGIPLKGNNTWSWIGYLPQMSLDINLALAGINPTPGDVIKAQTDFATWDGFQWVGPLQFLSPGNAYLYCNTGTEDMTLYYPSIARNAAPLYSPRFTTHDAQFTPVDPGKYPGNMTVTAVVLDGDQVVTNAEVGIFAGDECRASAFAEDGLWFLTIPGDKTELLTIKVATDNPSSTIHQKPNTLTYVEDAMIGTIAEPYIIQIGDDSAIDSVDGQKSGSQNTKIIKNGILYINHNGKTFTVYGAECK